MHFFFQGKSPQVGVEDKVIQPKIMCKFLLYSLPLIFLMRETEAWKAEEISPQTTY